MAASSPPRCWQLWPCRERRGDKVDNLGTTCPAAAAPPATPLGRLLRGPPHLQLLLPLLLGGQRGLPLPLLLGNQRRSLLTLPALVAPHAARAASLWRRHARHVKSQRQWHQILVAAAVCAVSGGHTLSMARPPRLRALCRRLWRREQHLEIRVGAGAAAAWRRPCHICPRVAPRAAQLLGGRGALLWRRVVLLLPPPLLPSLLLLLAAAGAQRAAHQRLHACCGVRQVQLVGRLLLLACRHRGVCATGS